MEKVSIILPTYNGARYLEQSLDSCLKQTYANIELIIVDDASTDTTPGILSSYSDPRLKVIRHKRNMRLPAALNTGFAHASGEYLTWTSDDNYYAPDAIATLAQYLTEHPEVGFVYSAAWIINAAGETIGLRESGPPEDLQKYNCVGPCFMYRQQVRDVIGSYNTKKVLSEDYEYWVRISKRFHMAYLEQPLYYYRHHSQSLTTTNYGAYRAQRLSLKIKRQYFDLPFKDYARQMSYWFMIEAFESHNNKDRANLFPKAACSIIYDPTCLRNRGLILALIESAFGQKAMLTMRKIFNSFMK